MVVELILPVISFVGGLYLIYRGVSNYQMVEGYRAAPIASAIPPMCEFSGKVRCDSPVQSRATKEDCAYSKTVIEYYAGGHPEWKEIISLENKASFSLADNSGKILINPEGVLVDPSPSQSFQGRTERFRKKGLLSRIKTFQQKATATSPLPEAESPVDAPLANIMEDKKAEHKLRRYLKKDLRISEYNLPQGSDARVVMRVDGADRIPLIISNKDTGFIRSYLKERTLITTGIGITLIIISVLVIFVLS